MRGQPQFNPLTQPMNHHGQYPGLEQSWRAPQFEKYVSRKKKKKSKYILFKHESFPWPAAGFQNLEKNLHGWNFCIKPEWENGETSAHQPYFEQSVCHSVHLLSLVSISGCSAMERSCLKKQCVCLAALNRQGFLKKKKNHIQYIMINVRSSRPGKKKTGH